MATSKTLLTIQQGTPVSASSTVTFLGIGSQGTAGARRILTHPTTTLAPITYDENPPLDANIDTDVLVAPIVSTVLTLDDTKVVRFERLSKDMIVEERWPGSASQVSMATFFFRQLYEYWINPPAAGQFITWEPRDKTSKKWQVELVALILGRDQAAYEATEFRDLGGAFKGGTILNSLDNLNALESGVLRAPVSLRMKIVAEVV